MTPYEFGKATALFTIGIIKESVALQGNACPEGHLFLSVCDCEDCYESVQEGYFPGIVCSLCGDYFEEQELDDDDVSE